jgi:hypothetical protein
VEDPKRPAGIWPFAWAAARQRISQETEIGLAINPPHRRSQDYLHIHILRLRQEARKGLMSRDPVTVERLEEVWDAGARHAARLGLGSYGMMVAAASGGKFMVIADGGSPARVYTQYDCR